MTDARVRLWGRDIAAVSWVAERALGVFQYVPEFVTSGIQVAPLMMPLRSAPYEFPGLPRETFTGLPGLVADSLPDRFGNALIDAWLAEQNRRADSFNPVERLCYIGNRGMGALEFLPALLAPRTTQRSLEVAALDALANRIVAQRDGLGGSFSGTDDAEAIEDILRVGTSAGGARAKAILAWNESSNEFRSGQLPAGQGFSYWLMKFDGVRGNRDKELADPQGFGLIEYAYSLMAKQAGVVMMPCRLHHEGGRSHFMTRRFDRGAKGEKLHMQSLCAMMHYDFNQAGAYSYEQAIQASKRLALPMEDIEQQFVRAVFNVVARNQDDHVKNIAYLMNQAGQWRLSPAFDVVYSYNPDGAWTHQHQMSINAKRDQFELADLLALAATGGIKRAKAMAMIDKVGVAVRGWMQHAESAGITDADAARIESALRLDLLAL